MEMTKGRWLFDNIRELNKAVSDARSEAEKEARQQSAWICSRGTFLATAALDGNQCSPNVEAECPTWKRTWKEIKDLVATVESDYPNVGEIYISGGYDGSDSMSNYYKYGDYEPWVSSWCIVLWTRKPDTLKESA
jgi:hypothetical protein